MERIDEMKLEEQKGSELMVLEEALRKANLYIDSLKDQLREKQIIISYLENKY